jgi:hypothetical protein
MTSIKDLQSKLKRFNAIAKTTESADELQSAWRRLFHSNLSTQGANSFAQYYREMRSKSKQGGARRKTLRRRKTRTKRRQRGGVAPVNYAMTPGIYGQTYGEFPVPVDTDPGSIRDLDVYFHDSLPLSPVGYWPKVPEDMGSNKVGGAHKRRRERKTRRRQRGGNLLESLRMMPLLPSIATPYPNVIQSINNAWSGGTTQIPAPASPVHHTWQLQGNSGASINPGIVTHIDDNFQRLASPAPWQTSN